MKLGCRFRIAGTAYLLVLLCTGLSSAQEPPEAPEKPRSLSYRLTAPPASNAQPQEQEQEQPPVAPAPAATPAPATTTAPEHSAETADHEAVFRAYAAYTASMRRQRLATAAGSLIGGGGLIATGAVINSNDSAWGSVLMICGGAFAFSGALALFVPTIAEQNAEEHRVLAAGSHSLEEAQTLRRIWKDEAQSARRWRYVGSGLSYLVGLAEISAGIAFAAGAGNFATDSDRAAMTGFWLGAGTMGLVGGTIGLIVRSPAEDSYESFVQTSATADQQRSAGLGLSLRPVAAGGTVGLAGSF